VSQKNILKSSDIKHLGKLALLEVKQKEEILYKGQLDEVLDYVSALQKENTKGVDETYQIVESKNAFYQGEANSLKRVDFLDQTKNVYQGYVRVSSVFSSDDE